LTVVFVVAFLRLTGLCLAADEAGAAVPRLIAPGVLTTFEQIWQLPESEQRQWHRVRLEYLVYYYDPLWRAMWGQSGGAESYLSIGSKVFPIKSGSRLLVEGLMQPAQGMIVEEPKVTVLGPSQRRLLCPGRFRRRHVEDRGVGAAQRRGRSRRLAGARCAVRIAGHSDQDVGELPAR
jgi:hypothetical protein